MKSSITRRELLAVGTGVALGRFAGAAAAMPNEEIIDIHPHLLSPDVQRYPPHPLGGAQSDWSKERKQPFEQYVAEANAAGVAKAAFVQVSTFYGVDNSYLADSIAKDRKRFTGVCSIDTLAPDAVSVLEGWMRRGMSGLRIFTGATDVSVLVDPRAFAVWDYAREQGCSICISTQAAGLPHVRALLERYPQVKVVLDHATSAQVDDGPPYRAAQPLFDLAAFRNFHIKVTPRTFALSRTGKATPDTFFPKLVSVFGAERLAFGSNMPSDPPPLAKLIADARSCFASLSSADRAMIFAGTAKKLYPVLA